MRSFIPGRISGCARLAMLALVLGLAACGEQSTDQSEFVGSWAESGQEWLTCNGTAATPTPIMDTFTVNRGVDAPLTVILTNPSCVLKFDVAGSTATLRPAQSCSETTMGVTVNLALSSGTFSLENESSGTLTFAGTAAGSSSTRSVQCTFSAMSTTTKVGQ